MMPSGIINSYVYYSQSEEETKLVPKFKEANIFPEQVTRKAKQLVLMLKLGDKISKTMIVFISIVD